MPRTVSGNWCDHARLPFPAWNATSSRRLPASTRSRHTYGLAEVHSLEASAAQRGFFKPKSKLEKISSPKNGPYGAASVAIFAEHCSGIRAQTIDMARCGAKVKLTPSDGRGGCYF